MSINLNTINVDSDDDADADVDIDVSLYLCDKIKKYLNIYNYNFNTIKYNRTIISEFIVLFFTFRVNNQIFYLYLYRRINMYVCV